MKAVPSAMRMASIQDELHRLERTKARLLGAKSATDDEDERTAAMDSLVSTQEEIDRVAQAWEDEQEDQAVIADM
jgi:flagellin-like hook-associated protein FlgL